MLLAFFKKNLLFRNSIIYVISKVLKNALPFLLLPVLTRYLSPSDYGLVATFDVVLGVAFVFVGLSLRGAVSINYFQLEKKEFRDYVGNVLLIEVVGFVILFAIGLLVNSVLADLISFPENWILIILFVALCRAIIQIALSLWQVRQQAISYGSFQIFQMALSICITLFLIIGIGKKWEGWFIGVSTSAFICAVISLLIMYRKNEFSLSINKRYIKDALIFGVPLIPHAFSGLIKTGIDRFFLNSMIGTNATGIYVVGYQVGMIIGVLATAFNQAWSPYLFKKLKENSFKEKVKIVKITYAYFAIILALSLILSLFAPFALKYLIGDSFQESTDYVIWIAFGYAGEGMYYMVVNYLFFVKKTYILAIISCITAIINTVLNYYFIIAYGPIGAAQATTISFFIGFLLTWALSAKIYKMPWGEAFKFSS